MRIATFALCLGFLPTCIIAFLDPTVPTSFSVARRAIDKRVRLRRWCSSHFRHNTLPDSCLSQLSVFDEESKTLRSRKLARCLAKKSSAEPTQIFVGSADDLFNRAVSVYQNFVDGEREVSDFDMAGAMGLISEVFRKDFEDVIEANYCADGIRSVMNVTCMRPHPGASLCAYLCLRARSHACNSA